MSARELPSSFDARLEAAFGARLPELYSRAVAAAPPAELPHAMELRSFLALVEKEVGRVRDHIHAHTAPDRAIWHLSAVAVRTDAERLEAALSARKGYCKALASVIARQRAAQRTTSLHARAASPAPAPGTAPVRAAHPH
ncbi:hypothetical protein ACFY1V_12970 [Streptomyces sp. NPDC001255]|uniref:hypothetical protein n=1 Tax=Streptomyces sp. NPDC001255 TaxID=3364550 RepID=UPI003692EB48